LLGKYGGVTILDSSVVDLDEVSDEFLDEKHIFKAFVPAILQTGLEQTQTTYFSFSNQ